jgi:tetratricopeptide (TPR) repeat protein
MHLSLADVAEGHYSTSLISQIERNKVDPSQESLRFLADRLQLPLEDLEILAQQQRESDVEEHQYKSYEELRGEVAHLLARKHVNEAIEQLEHLYFPQVPPLQRWRLAALRGQCYYEQRKFLKAQQDFVYAVNELPKLEGMQPDQNQELMLLHLHLAGTYRELEQLEDALEQYRITLQMMNHDTPFGYVAEAHWGMALIAFTQASKMQRDSQEKQQYREKKLRTALEHAENARFLYRSIGETLRAASVTCQIAYIERELGNIESVYRYLEELLATWKPVLQEPEADTPEERRNQRERASIVSAAACSLASIALEQGKREDALEYADWALRAGTRSYKLRQADAYIMLGSILEAINLYDPAAEAAFRRATEVLEDTERIGARINAHMRLGRYLLKREKKEEGERELEKAHMLSDIASASSATPPSEEVA